jgi:protein TonB
VELARTLWAPLQERRMKARVGLAIAASLALHVALAESLPFVPAPWVQLGAGSARIVARLVATSDGPGAPAAAEAATVERHPAEPPASARTDASSAPRKNLDAPAADKIAVPTAPAPHYFLGSELERRPAALAPIEPRYPENAGPDGGYLVLRLLINESGLVDRARVLVSDPEGVFDQSAVSAFGGTRFSPGMRHGAAVKSQMLVELKYHAKPEQRAAAR